MVGRSCQQAKCLSLSWQGGSNCFATICSPSRPVLATPGDSLSYDDQQLFGSHSGQRRPQQVNICAFQPTLGGNRCMQRPRYGEAAYPLLACERRDTSYHSPFPEVRSDSRSDRNNGDQSGLGRDLCGPRDPKGRGLQRNGAIKGSMGGERGR